MQVVLTLMLGYPWSFDPWEFLFKIVSSAIKDGKDHIFVPPVLESVILVISKEKHTGTINFLKRVHIQLYYLKRHNL